MKTLRRILLAFLVLAVVFLLVGFILPKHVHVEHSLYMTAPREVIFNQVNNLRNWMQWSPWHQIDTNMKITYSGAEKGTGASFSYQSENTKVGSGKLTITNSVPYDSIVIEMDFMEHGKSTGIFRLVPDDSSTFVTWIIESELGNNPVSRWFGLFMNWMIGPDFEKGLAKIDEITAGMPPVYSPVINEKEVPARVVLSVRDTCTPTTMGSKMEMIYGNISGIIKRRKLIVSGAPFAIYHSYSPQVFDIEAGIPVSAKIEITGNVKCSELPAQTTVMASYWGPYNKIADTYNAIESHIKEKKLTIAGPPWEVYITDPQTEPDTAKWQTDVYYPIK